MTAVRARTGKPLPIQAPTAFVRVRPKGHRCAESRSLRIRCRAATSRLPRQ